MTCPETRRIEIHLGTRCNNRCVFCMSADRRDKHEPWATLERIKAELRHFREKGAPRWGSSAAAHRAPNILRAWLTPRSSVMLIAMCTNGTRLRTRLARS